MTGARIGKDKASVTNMERTPESFGGARLLAKDFDGTVAQTFEAAPSGLGVEGAYLQVIDNLFGPTAADVYNAAGGLKNRAPLEVIHQLAAEASDTEARELLDRLIDGKLDILLEQIGTRLSDGARWPRPMPGYLELRERIAIARESGRLIDDLILSSGHEPFILRVYEMWGSGQPTHVVAEERMKSEGLAHHVKPSSVLMDVAHRVWLANYNVSSTDNTMKNARLKTLYVGDDTIKDGELAQNSGVDNFMHISQENSEQVWRAAGRWLDIEGGVTSP